jgi:predicted RNA-binding protein
MYCGHAYKSKDNFTLHKALLLLEDVFLVTKDDETVRATLSMVQGAETSGGIQSINMDTSYRSGNTMHLAGESKEKKGWGFPC